MGLTLVEKSCRLNWQGVFISLQGLMDEKRDGKQSGQHENRRGQEEFGITAFNGKCFVKIAKHHAHVVPLFLRCSPRASPSPAVGNSIWEDAILN